MRLLELAPPATGYSLALHGGAGGRVEELTLVEQGTYAEGLTAAYQAGAAVLASGGSALDAVCASVEVLEDDPLFNAGRGAALTAAGTAELDACVMTGDGHAGAVAASRFARHPVRAARKVMEESRSVLLVDPSASRITGWGLETVDAGWFVTPARQQQLANVQAGTLAAGRHGTVGAVAVDVRGRVAAATSTGGMVNQSEGRIGDSPIVGAGTYARDGVVAISCTGEGEAFIQGTVAGDIAARVRYLGQPLGAAVEATVVEELDRRSAMGGLVAVRPDGSVVVAHNSPAMFAAFHDGTRLVTLT
ncbi:isoaspartyl peptidase/L-asparaginase [Modestobacter sp. NPDC049651]|uniref:isoaspartyl peptidase/L-asparaginase family protein n=1 Tax=unclassified Modestobacter TaxID=2643866 RepID=UPI0033C2EBEE